MVKMSAHGDGSRYNIGDDVEFCNKKRGMGRYKIDSIDCDNKGKKWYILIGADGMYPASDLKMVKRKEPLKRNKPIKRSKPIKKKKSIWDMDLDW
jgi:hypothetical protein